MRVNVVRNVWKIDHPDNALMRSFQDRSLWEDRKLEGPDAIKRLIREGVEYTSAVCVLIGTDTWVRRWVRYEIARAIIDVWGLLGVHLNSIRHHHTKTPHTRGLNPLDYMAVGKVQSGVLSTPRYYLFEKQAVLNGVGGYSWLWNRYSDYTSSVTFRVMNRNVGNLPPMPGVFPDYPAPVIRNAGAEREMVMMRWGMPPPPRAGGYPVTNIRNTSSPHWRGWLKPENRCLVPANSFAEYAPEPNPNTKKKDVVWFALNEDRPLFAFGGLWTEFKGDRGTKSKPIPGPHLVYGF